MSLNVTYISDMARHWEECDGNISIATGRCWTCGFPEKDTRIKEEVNGDTRAGGVLGDSVGVDHEPAREPGPAVSGSSRPAGGVAAEVVSRNQKWRAKNSDAYNAYQRRYQRWVRLGRPGGEFKEWRE